MYNERQEFEANDSHYDNDGRLVVCPYELSDNQKTFVKDAEAQGHDVYYDYSGRGMYGRLCPAINVYEVARFNTEANVTQDSMGLGQVYYARR